MKIFGILIGILTGIASAHKFKNCNSGNKVNVSELTFSTEEINPGTNLGITITGNTWTEFDKNTVAEISLKMLGVHFYTTSVKPCEEFSGLNCPIIGKFKGTLNYGIPDYSPHAKFDMEVKLLNGNELLGCFETEIDIRSKLGDFTHYKNIFDVYVKKFDWKLDNYLKRLNIFTKNLLKVVEHNLKTGTGYKLELNEFAHLTQDEFWMTHGGSQKIVTTQSAYIDLDVKVPDSVDWRSKLVPVKNQGQCGSCFAYSAICSSEFAYYLKTGKVVSFSEQQIVSCDTKDHNCNGGLMNWVFDWEENHQGFCLSTDYPYVSGNGIVPVCKKCNNIKDSIVKNFVDIPINNEEELKKVVSERVVSAAIAVNSNFQFYKSGVFSGICPGTQLNHGIAIVGYGTDKETGLDYWIIRNSWGTTWGEDGGYIRIQRNKKGFFNKSGQCGILAQNSYPLMV